MSPFENLAASHLMNPAAAGMLIMLQPLAIYFSDMGFAPNKHSLGAMNVVGQMVVSIQCTIGQAVAALLSIIITPLINCLHLYFPWGRNPFFSQLAPTVLSAMD